MLDSLGLPAAAPARLHKRSLHCCAEIAAMVNEGERDVSEMVALVAGATRGAGRAIAVRRGATR